MALVVPEALGDCRTDDGMQALLAVAVASMDYWNYMEDNYSLSKTFLPMMS